MKIPEKTEVVVIGGGAWGCSIAYQLAKKGKEVILFEMQNLCSGASGRCGGMMVQLYGGDLTIDKTKERFTFAKYSYNTMMELQDEIGEFEFRERGCLDLATNEEEWEVVKNIIKIQKELGDSEIELLDKKQVHELMPSLSDIALGGRWRATDGNLNPFKYTYKLAEGAKKYGAQVFIQTKANKIIDAGEKVEGVVTDKGTIKAEWVVNAANVWVPYLTPEIEIAPVRQLSMATEQAPALKVVPFEVPAPGYPWGTTQTASGNIVIGGAGPMLRDKERFTCFEDHFNEQVSMEDMMECAGYMADLVPELASLNIIRCWAGTIGCTSDGVPNIGFVPSKKNLLVAASSTGGMSEIAGVGKAIAEFIDDGKPSIPMDIYDPARFKDKKAVWPPQPYDLGSIMKFLLKLQKKEKGKSFPEENCRASQK